MAAVAVVEAAEGRLVAVPFAAGVHMVSMKAVACCTVVAARVRLEIASAGVVVAEVGTHSVDIQMAGADCGIVELPGCPDSIRQKPS